MASRRLFLTGGAAVTALTVIGSETLVQASAAPPSTVDPVPPGASGHHASPNAVGGVTKSFVHRGKKVDITLSDSAASATINGRTKVHLERWNASQFHAHALPFQVFSDPTQLVKTLMDAEAAELFIL